MIVLTSDLSFRVLEPPVLICTCYQKCQRVNNDTNSLNTYNINPYFEKNTVLKLGLFHGVMSASGTAGAPFAFQKQPIEQAKRLGKKLRCPSNRKTEAMVACLGQAEVQRLVESHREAVVIH